MFLVFEVGVVRRICDLIVLP